MLKEKLKLAGILIGSLTVIAAPTVYAVATIDDGTKEFVEKAAVANQFEIVSSKLAVTKTSNEKVKDLANQMIADHGKAGQELKSILAAKKQSDLIPAEGLDKKHENIVTELQSAPADKFDDKYIKAQSDAHDEAVTLFKGYSEDGKDAELKAFATKTLPVLEQHKEHVKELSK